jgi:hypothetical protein
MKKLRISFRPRTIASVCDDPSKKYLYTLSFRTGLGLPCTLGGFQSFQSELPPELIPMEIGAGISDLS